MKNIRLLFIKAIDKTSDKGLLRELNTLVMCSRISRLDKLYGETLMELDKLGRYTSEPSCINSMTNLLREVNQ